MSPAEAMSGELVPSGIRDLPTREPSHRICRGCGEDLFLAPHGPRCPARAEIFLSITTDPAVRRAEDVLAACTRKAWRAALAAGGRP